jgi:hypothetical protein
MPHASMHFDSERTPDVSLWKMSFFRATCSLVSLSYPLNTCLYTGHVNVYRARRCRALALKCCTNGAVLTHRCPLQLALVSGMHLWFSPLARKTQHTSPPRSREELCLVEPSTCLLFMTRRRQSNRHEPETRSLSYQGINDSCTSCTYVFFLSSKTVLSAKSSLWNLCISLLIPDTLQAGSSTCMTPLYRNGNY